jgi:hypothetical protein
MREAESGRGEHRNDSETLAREFNSSSTVDQRQKRSLDLESGAVKGGEGERGRSSALASGNGASRGKRDVELLRAFYAVTATATPSAPAAPLAALTREFSISDKAMVG